MRRFLICKSQGSGYDVPAGSEVCMCWLSPSDYFSVVSLSPSLCTPSLCRALHGGRSGARSSQFVMLMWLFYVVLLCVSLPLAAMGSLNTA